METPVSLRRRLTIFSLLTALIAAVAYAGVQQASPPRMDYGEVLCLTTATLVPVTAGGNRTNFSLANKGPNEIYFGDANVTTGTGFPVPAGSMRSIDVGVSSTGPTIYCIAATAAQVTGSGTRYLGIR